MMAGDKHADVSGQTGPVKRKHRLGPGMAGALALLLIAGTLLVWWTIQRVDREKRQALLLQARLVARSLNVENIKSLSGTGADLQNPAYLEIKRQFAAVKKGHDQLRFVYLLGRRPDRQIFFFADNEPPDSDDYSPPRAGIRRGDIRCPVRIFHGA